MTDEENEAKEKRRSETDGEPEEDLDMAVALRAETLAVCGKSIGNAKPYRGRK